MDKTLDVKSIKDAKSKVSDIKVVGNGDTFQLLCKASSESQGWMKSCKAMQVPGGCVVQVTTQQYDNVAEALTFVPGVIIQDDVNGGRKLVSGEDCCQTAVNNYKKGFNYDVTAKFGDSI